MAFRRGFQLEAHCFASQTKPCSSKMEQTAGPFCGSTTIARPGRTSLVVFVVIGEFVWLPVVMGDARARRGRLLTGRAMGLGSVFEPAPGPHELGRCAGAGPAPLSSSAASAQGGRRARDLLEAGRLGDGRLRAAGALAARLASPQCTGRSAPRSLRCRAGPGLGRGLSPPAARGAAGCGLAAGCVHSSGCGI